MEDFKIPERALALVRAGVIQVSVLYTETGIDTWARAAYPLACGLNPNQSMSIDEILTLVDSHETRDTISNRKDATVSRKPAGKVVSVTQAFNRVKHHNLGVVVTDNGLKNTLPMDSLTIHDVNRSEHDFLCRAIVVAHTISCKTIAERIRTDPFLRVKGASDLQTWWENATAKQRLYVLSRKNHRTSLGDSCDDGLTTFVNRVPCPFRVTPFGLETDDEQESRPEVGLLEKTLEKVSL